MAENDLIAANEARFEPTSKNHTPPRSLQDRFLAALRDQDMPVRVFLVNGVQLRGNIEAFDSFSVWLGGEEPKMVYKHAISTIVVVGERRVTQGSAETEIADLSS